MNMLNRLKRIAKKIVHGESITSVRQSPEHWDAQFKAGKWNFMLERQPNQEVIAGLCEKYAKSTPIEILDVGCGNGGLLKLLENKKFKYVYCGLDFSQAAIDQAKTFFPNSVFICADIEYPPQPGKKFDIIVLSEILYYVDTEKVIAEYVGLLKEDGVFVISMYNSWRTWLLWFKIKKPLKELEHHTSSRSENGKNVYWNIKVMQLRTL